ncbi:MAG: transcriptional repressor [Thermoguttaceae bacterium]|nr:transcriptional repressor [Thermoguttaceae bacterium]MBR5758902.1 transcriptional repressor [Thermoguttaceae bacterium]
MLPTEDPVFQEFNSLCHGLGWRVTASRLAVYRYIRGNGNHPVVDEVWKAVQREQPNISRESVYRILTDFVSKGLISLIVRPDVVARYDSNPQRHDHFYCLRCGKITDFNVDEVDGIVRNKLSQFGRVDRIEARASGICRDCLDKELNSNQ